MRKWWFGDERNILFWVSRQGPGEKKKWGKKEWKKSEKM
jgi:hypothetical protein